MKNIEEDIIPFGFVDDGLQSEDYEIDPEGNIWH